METFGFIRQDAYHVVGAAQAAAHADMENAGCALLLKLAVQGGHILGQGQGSLGQLRLKDLVDLLGANLIPVAEFPLTGHHAQ